MNSLGVVYIVTKSIKHLKEAIFSAKSLHKKSPHINVTLMTDLDLTRKDTEYKYFNQILKVEANEHPLKLKVKLLSNSPYQQTLFLDSDTEILKDITPIFTNLNNCDFAICNAPNVDWSYSPNDSNFFKGYHRINSFNTGVFLYSNSTLVKKFLQQWYETMKPQDESQMSPGKYCDQHYFNKIFRKVLKDNILRVEILDNCIWNARGFLYKQFKKDNLLNNIAIYHGRPPFSKISKREKYRWLFYIKSKLSKLATMVN